jgi:hypothetical protein
VSTGHAACLYCAGKKVAPEVAIETARSKSLEPLEDFPGVVVPWKLKCLKCNQETFATLTALNKKRDGAGCSSCTPYGFKPALQSFFYLIENENRDAYKIGISNLDGGRLGKHQKNGWQILSLMKFEHGSDAYLLEQAILAWIRRELKLPPAFLKGDGWTETIMRSDIEPRAILRQAKKLAPSKFTKVSALEISKTD